VPLRPGIAIVVPALNEAANIAAAVERCQAAARRHFQDHEIIVVDDGSTDETAQIADRLAEADPKIRVVHHERPRNLGSAYKAGVALARFEYLLMFPGDNEGTDEQLDAVMSRAGTADVVINYISNAEVRGWRRRLISRLFVALMNGLFGLSLRYYNGTVLHHTAIIRSITIHTDSFAYQAEALVKLLRRGHSYVEVGTPIAPRRGGRTKAFRVRNAIDVGRALCRLVVDVRR
jgi:dolichol-phosphate mannosyltransferase